MLETDIQDIPDAVIQSQIMLLLGPKYLLNSIGSTSRHYRSLAQSNAVWNEFCAWHDRTHSQVFTRIVEKCNISSADTEIQEDVLDVARRWFEGFEASNTTTEPSSFNRYKFLCDGSFWINETIECRVCNEGDFVEERDNAIKYCIVPSCGYSVCPFHFIAQLQRDDRPVRTCDWCKVPACQLCGWSMLVCCDLCTKSACLDCQKIVGMRGQQYYVSTDAASGASVGNPLQGDEMTLLCEQCARDHPGAEVLTPRDEAGAEQPTDNSTT